MNICMLVMCHFNFKKSENLLFFFFIPCFFPQCLVSLQTAKVSMFQPFLSFHLKSLSKAAPFSLLEENVSKPSSVPSKHTNELAAGQTTVLVCLGRTDAPLCQTLLLEYSLIVPKLGHLEWQLERRSACDMDTTIRELQFQSLHQKYSSVIAKQLQKAIKHQMDEWI